MSAIQPTKNTGLIVDEFIRYATSHLTTVSGMANTVSLYPPLSTPAPGVVLWTGYSVTPATPSVTTPTPAKRSIAEIYEKLDFNEIPLDKFDDEVQEIINPNQTKIQAKIDAAGGVEQDLISTTQLNNIKAQIIEDAARLQGIIKVEPEAVSIIKSAYKNLNELLKKAGDLAPGLGKNARINYENLKRGYDATIHGLCPQGTQSVVAALTGIKELGKIYGHADWFSFKSPGTGTTLTGASSFAISVNGTTYYNDKVSVDLDWASDSSNWQIGDILAQGYTAESKRPYGHIQVWTGWNWLSDFTQNQTQKGNVDWDTVALWRLNENGKQAVENLKSA